MPNETKDIAVAGGQAPEEGQASSAGDFDPVTNVASGSAFRRQLESLAAEASSSGRPLCLALFDIDRLGALNESSGAVAGDRALRAIALLLQKSARPGSAPEQIGRYSPGQLAQALPNMATAAALELAERIRVAVEASMIGQLDGHRAITVSGAVVELPLDAKSVTELCARAEEVVRRAKRLGRNRCLGVPPKLLLVGNLVAIVEAKDALLARGEFLVVEQPDPKAAIETLLQERPTVVVAQLKMGRRELDRMAALLKLPELAKTRVILVTPEPPDPSLVELAERVPGGHLTMGQFRLAARVAEAVAQALGVRQRRDLRTGVRLPVHVEMTERGYREQGTVLDLSESGARLAVTRSIPVGELIGLEFRLSENLIKLVAVAVRASPSAEGFEVGVRFEAPNEETLRLLRMAVGSGEAGLQAASAARQTVAKLAPQFAFELSEATRKFGVFAALQPMSLSVRAGERLAIIGPSGAGKSTLLRLLNTSLMPTGGKLLVLGQDPTSLGPRALRALRSRIGTVYQQLLLIPQATVLQNVVAGRLGSISLLRATLSLLSRNEANRVASVLDQVGLVHKIYERLDTLSGGEQQRVAIARTLYQNPEVVIADEPLASVDPTRSAEIIDLFLKIGKERTLILSTHQLEPVLPYFQRVIGLRRGQILFDKERKALNLEDLAKLYESERASRPTYGHRIYSPVPEFPTGVVSLGASQTPGEFILPKLVTAFLREHKGVRLNLGVKTSNEIIQELIAGRIELGFVGARVPHPDLHFEDFAEDEIILVAAPHFKLPQEPLPPSLVARLPRVERDGGSGTRAVVEDHFSNMGVAFDPGAVVLEIGTLIGLKAAVVSGVGVALTSRLGVELDIERGALRQVKIDQVKIPRRFFVAWRRGVALTAPAKRFLEFARGAVQGNTGVEAAG
ncbi:MAG: ATP-binding cassette domain-containing protein [Myxococcales bacterium]|nr:ATP-binding cassette domain-containing protein [Myxococcales bacterium]